MTTTTTTVANTETVPDWGETPAVTVNRTVQAGTRISTLSSSGTVGDGPMDGANVQIQLGDQESPEGTLDQSVDTEETAEEEMISKKLIFLESTVPLDV